MDGLRTETTALELPLVLDTGARTQDVVLEATPDTPGATVLARLTAHVSGSPDGDPHVRCVRTGRSIRPELPLAAAGLLRGDRLLVGDVARVRAAVEDVPDRTQWDLVVVGGPAAGRRLPLGTGEIVVGSDAACEVAIDDPALSSWHVLLHVEEEHIEVEDAGSRNGTALPRAGCSS
jgi:S-DNA-T family DNA segregation ATPase FtsK/SpoIIIE